MNECFIRLRLFLEVGNLAVCLGDFNSRWKTFECWECWVGMECLRGECGRIGNSRRRWIACASHGLFEIYDSLLIT
jgi:hypothetical protein